MDDRSQSRSSDVKAELSRDELEAELKGKSRDIDRRLDVLQAELASSPEDVRRAVLKHPLVSVGGSLVAGLLVGLLVQGLRKRKRRNRSRTLHRRLIDQYMDAVARDVRYEIGRGRETEEAVRAALQDRVPLVVYGEEPAGSSKGALRHTFDFVVKTSLGFAIKSLLDSVTSQVALDEHLVPPEGGNGNVGVAAAVGEE